MNYSKAPFPWFGGKSKAADAVWSLLGDCRSYVEPFFGSGAVLIRRPHEPNRTYHSETVNDVDGLLVNAWRGIQLRPDETAEAASWPVSEADLHARHCALLRWREEHQLEHLMGDPAWCDPIMAGWWLWGQSSWIGGGWCSGSGPWWPDETGRLAKRGKDGVKRCRPYLGDAGRGVNRPQAREPGVSRQIPHLGDNGRGVNHASSREPGVEYHPVCMPKLREWMHFLSARLRHVRIVNGDWRRVCGRSVVQTLGSRPDECGVFLDPPYSEDVRSSSLYACDSAGIAADVRSWCEEATGHGWRIVLAGFAGEGHERLLELGWTEDLWYSGGYLQGGMAQQGPAGSQQHRERLWSSPACLSPAQKAQRSLF